MFYNSNTTHHGISDVTLWKDEQYLLKLKKKSQKTTYFDLCGRLISRILFSSVVQLCLTLVRSNGLQHARPPCPSPIPGACSNSCPLSRWCHPTISYSVVPFSSCLQSFPASGSFPMSQFFASGGQSIGASAAEFLCMGRCKSLGSLWSFLSYASQLPGASISHFFHSLSSSVFTTGSGFSLAAAR